MLESLQRNETLPNNMSMNLTTPEPPADGFDLNSYFVNDFCSGHMLASSIINNNLNYVAQIDHERPITHKCKPDMQTYLNDRFKS